MSIGSLIFFSLSVIGLTNIVVDPAVIFSPIRNRIDKMGISWLSKLFSCYQCAGTWAGFICGIFIFGLNPFIIFCCGMAGSFLANFAATYMNYLEAKSIIEVSDDE